MADNMASIAGLRWYLHLLLFPLAFALILIPMSVSQPVFDIISAQFAAMDGFNVLGSVIPTFLTVFLCIVVLAAVLAVGLAGFMMGLLSFFAVFTRAGRGGR